MLVINFLLNRLSYAALMANDATKEQSDTIVCFMLKLDTVYIIVGLLVRSSGRTHLENVAFCLGDNGSLPNLSLR